MIKIGLTWTGQIRVEGGSEAIGALEGRPELRVNGPGDCGREEGLIGYI